MMEIPSTLALKKVRLVLPHHVNLFSSQIRVLMITFPRQNVFLDWEPRSLLSTVAKYELGAIEPGIVGGGYRIFAQIFKFLLLPS